MIHTENQRRYRCVRRASHAYVLGLVLAVLCVQSASAQLPTYAPRENLFGTGSDQPQEAGTADFNCDGIPDVVLLQAEFVSPLTFPVRIFLADGHGGFSDGTSQVVTGTVPRVQWPRDMLIEDFNGDGRPDVFVADTGRDLAPLPGYQNSLLLSTSDCHLVNATSGLPQQNDITHSATTADVDGDGDLDLFLGNHWGGTPIPPQLQLNDGSGRFTIAPGALPPAYTDLVQNAFTTVEFVDVDGDGDPDLVLGADHATLNSAVLLNDGTGRFSLLPNAMPPKPFAATDNVLDIKASDLNGDGSQDLILVASKENYTGRWMQVLINNGGGTFRDETASRMPQTNNINTWFIFAQFVDIDGDGNLDVIGQVPYQTGINGGGDHRFHINNGSGVFTQAAMLQATLDGVFALVDINGDGHRDVLSFGEVFTARVRNTGPVLPPGIPQGVRVTRTMSDRVRVSWKYVWGATRYEVWRSTSAGAPASMIGTTTAVSFDDTAASASPMFYSVRAANSAATSSSSAIVVGNLVNPPTIVTQPTNQVTTTGNNAVFSILAGNSPTSYRWQTSTNGGGSWTDLVPGAQFANVNTPSLLVSGASLALNGARYRCVASNLAGSVTSASATLTVTIDTLNLSRDLVSRGIAAQNLVPNSPSLDARPLMQAGLEYARNHHIGIVTIDRGAYYFLTPQSSDRYLNLDRFTDMTIDLAGSTFYLKSPFLQGFALGECQRVTLTNFQIDFLQLPYTQVRLTSVDAAARRLSYQTLPGWVDPQTFNGAASPYGPLELAVVAFRDGAMVPGTSRMSPASPIGGSVVTIVQDGAPWTQTSTLSTLRAGDTLVVLQRGGGSPLQFFRGDSLVVSNVSVFGSATWAVNMDQLTNSVVDHVNVLPKPGTDRLIGSNGDGIHFSSSRQNNHVRNCHLARTFDDAIAMDSAALGAVLQKTGPRQLRVRRSGWWLFSNGTPVTFVDPSTTLEIFNAVITSQNPPDSAAVFNGEVDLQLDRDLPTLPSGTFFVFGTDELRGSGSTIEDNVVDDTVAGRGIWLAGNRGVTIRRNRIGRTARGGIVVFQQTQGILTPPVRDVIVESNIVVGAMGPMNHGTGSQVALGGIMVASIDNHGFAFAHTPANHGVTIRSNFVADSGHTGIWVGELDGGTVQDNLIVRWNRHPELPIWGLNPADAAIAQEDFSKAMALRFSANVAVIDNTTELESTIDGAVSLLPKTALLTNAAAVGVVAVHSNVRGLSWTASSDAAWLTIASGGSGTGDGSVQYSVTANTTAAPRTATIDVAGVAFQVTQYSTGTIPSSMALDKVSLRFGAVTSGSVFLLQTAPQSVRLTQSGTTPVSWTATPSQPWLNVSPASGTGSTVLSISVVPSAGLAAAGSVAATVNLAFNGSSNSPGPVSITLTLVPSGTSASPFGVVDTPVDNTTGVTGAVPFTGWALDDLEVTRVMICRAAFGGETAPADPNCGGASQIFVGFGLFIDGARPDVGAAFPAYPLSSRGGWGFMVLTNMLPNQGNGTYQFFAYAQDREGHTALLGSRTMSCDNAHATKPFGAIDTPTQGGVASGASYVNFGWALTQAGKSIPNDGSTIQVLIDGVAIGNVDYNHYRPDIAALFPGFANSNAAIGFRVLDTTTMPNGLHTIAWVVSDSAGAVAGIGSRFFTVSNGVSTVTATSRAESGMKARAEDANAAPLETAAVIARRGWDLSAPWHAYGDGREGRAVLRGEELDRFELWLAEPARGTYRGYARVGHELGPLPIGSQLNAETGWFTWAPGAGFVGVYDLVFVRSADGRAVARQEVRVILAPKGSGHIGTQVEIDTPRAQQTADQPFVLAGWAADLDAVAGTGIEALHVWAYPTAGGPPVFLGTPQLGGIRPDVAAVHGDRFREAGFGMTVQGLAAGSYDVAVFPWSNVIGAYGAPKVLSVTVR